MNKNDFIKTVAEKAGVPQAQARSVIDAIFGTQADAGVIVEQLANAGKLTLSGFGTFSVRTRAARTGVSPATGEKIQIPEKTVPKFKFAPSLIAEFN